VILAIAIGLTLTLGASGTALARDARGAFIINSNHPDPTVPRHRHRIKVKSRRTFPNEPQCCGSIPMIHTETCGECGYQVEHGTRLAPNGALERFRTRSYLPR
jgi:hypothetical protein